MKQSAAQPGTDGVPGPSLERNPALSPHTQGAFAPLGMRWTVERPFQPHETEQRALAVGQSLAHHYGYGWAVRDTYIIPEFDEIQIFAGRYMIGEF
ncbi:hypothetical protein [Streptomyces halstedii]|uniref:Uncharacterized protein n=1 Tax=Streptomyces halstedii TaxID=1944 RepID=A0A6N9TVA7_STRHA|nr:hypothetical protein [Streptomyces halstedii]NEA15441.1 hypothetical protein [Streptomyces halstedii]